MNQEALTKKNIRSLHLLIVAAVLYVIGLFITNMVGGVLIIIGLAILCIGLKVKADEIKQKPHTMVRDLYRTVYVLGIAASCYFTSWLVGGFLGDLIGTVGLVAIVIGIYVGIKTNGEIKKHRKNPEN